MLALQIGSEIVYVCLVMAFFLVGLVIAASALAKYLAEKNAAKWEKRLAKEREKQTSDDD